MTASILSFHVPERPLAPKMPWQNQDLAELYRVRDRLCEAGMSVDAHSGVSDEGDPWFVYQQGETVVVHIARIDDEIHVVNCVSNTFYTGRNFREVSDRMLDEAPVALNKQFRRNGNVVLHPSALLMAFVAAAVIMIDMPQSEASEDVQDGHIDVSAAPDGLLLMPLPLTSHGSD